MMSVSLTQATTVPSTMEFREALGRCFRLLGKPQRDNLPCLARPRHQVGWIKDRGRASLAKLMRFMGVRIGVEIGTHRGESARLWCRINPELHLVCIDPYQRYNSRPSQNAQDECYEVALTKLQQHNAEILRASSLEVVDTFKEGSLDFVYIDGDHQFDAVVQDLVRWAPKVRNGGLIILHDYTVMWRGGVMAAIDAYTHCHRIDPWYVTQDPVPTAFWEQRSNRV